MSRSDAAPDTSSALARGGLFLDVQRRHETPIRCLCETPIRCLCETHHRSSGADADEVGSSATLRDQVAEDTFPGNCHAELPQAARDWRSATKLPRILSWATASSSLSLLDSARSTGHGPPPRWCDRAGDIDGGRDIALRSTRTTPVGTVDGCQAVIFGARRDQTPAATSTRPPSERPLRGRHSHALRESSAKDLAIIGTIIRTITCTPNCSSGATTSRSGITCDDERPSRAARPCSRPPCVAFAPSAPVSRSARRVAPAASVEPEMRDVSLRGLPRARGARRHRLPGGEPRRTTVHRDRHPHQVFNAPAGAPPQPRPRAFARSQLRTASDDHDALAAMRWRD